jgi:RNA polymerase sigma-70 factor (ECF subfamily)
MEVFLMLMLYMSMIDSSEEKRKFERLYLAHKQTMYYVALGILKDVQEAEDAVHQAFLRVMDRLDKIDEQDCHKTRAYLVVITESTAIDIYRKRKRARTVSFDELEIYIASDIESDYEEKDAIIRAINALPVNYAVVLKLRYSHGHTDGEIAALLNITEENVRQRIARAKKKLNKLLEAEGVAL